MRGSRPALLLAAGSLLLLVVLVARGESAVPSSMSDVPLERGQPVVIGGCRGTSTSVPSLPEGADLPSECLSPSAGLQFSPNDPALFGKVIITLAVVMAVLAIVLSALTALRNRRRVGVGVVVDPAEGTIDTVMRLRLKEAVTQARDLLARAGGAPRDAVIQAWVTLENATEHQRAPHQTATEFTVDLLTKESVDEGALRELRTLYQRARFGHESGEDDARRARAALDRILATIQ